MDKFLATVLVLLHIRGFPLKMWRPAENERVISIEIPPTHAGGDFNESIPS